MHTYMHTHPHTHAQYIICHAYTHTLQYVSRTSICVCITISPCLSLISEGQLGISPMNCDSLLNDICVKNILPGQSVKLCTRKTLVPSTPPEGHVIKFIQAHWRKKRSEGNFEELYECFENGSCVEESQTTPPVDYHRYSDVNDSCITISGVQEDKIFSLELLVNPDIEYSSRTVTFALQTIKGSVWFGHTQSQGYLYCSVCNDAYVCLKYDSTCR